MILIADSGATKTDWRWIDKKDNIHSFSTVGFSPLFQTSAEIYSELKKKIPGNIKHQTSNIKHIFFYGTGCSGKLHKNIIRTAIKKVFPRSKSTIEHDMLSAARAICGNKKGIACILGTGSNSCYYDGEKITQNLGGLTYILGDEGSGAHIGKEFIKSYLNNELPVHLHKIFQSDYRLTKDKIVDSVYNKKYPNRYLASFAKFIREHIDEPFLHGLTQNCFAEFFEKTICKYENHTYVPVGFIGSIAFYFKNILKEVAKEKGVTITKIIKSPVEELVKYHLSS